MSVAEPVAVRGFAMLLIHEFFGVEALVGHLVLMKPSAVTSAQREDIVEALETLCPAHRMVIIIAPLSQIGLVLTILTVAVSKVVKQRD